MKLLGYFQFSLLRLLAVFCRARLGVAFKEFIEVTRIGKPEALGDFRDGHISKNQEAFRFIDQHIMD